MEKLVSLKAVVIGQPFELSHHKDTSPALKCAVILNKWHPFISDIWKQNHATKKYKAGTTSFLFFFYLFKIIQFMICKGDFEEVFFFSFLILCPV